FVTGVTTRPGALGAYTARAEVGVGVFFLISGFLLYRPFARAHLSGRPRPPTGPFLVRRALRILPLYWAALVVTLALDPVQRPGHPGGLALEFVLGQNYGAEDDVHRGIPQAWSLDIELLFYLLLPVWAAMLARRARSPRRQLRVELAALAGL